MWEACLSAGNLLESIVSWLVGDLTVSFSEKYTWPRAGKYTSLIQNACCSPAARKISLITIHQNILNYSLGERKCERRGSRRRGCIPHSCRRQDSTDYDTYEHMILECLRTCSDALISVEMVFSVARFSMV